MCKSYRLDGNQDNERRSCKFAISNGQVVSMACGKSDHQCSKFGHCFCHPDVPPLNHVLESPRQTTSCCRRSRSSRTTERAPPIAMHRGAVASGYLPCADRQLPRASSKDVINRGLVDGEGLGKWRHLENKIEHIKDPRAMKTSRRIRVGTCINLLDYVFVC